MAEIGQPTITEPLQVPDPIERPLRSEPSPAPRPVEAPVPVPA